ncbi:MAG: FAD-linked oxidase C-terminal domain-containing protein [Bacteroidales bacterium]|nr:FAD-linked oxidase C-terminal domain-containing protein [Bacteroidales bacterium]
MSNRQATYASGSKTDLLHRILYSTDASAYRELPEGVIYPRSKDELIDAVKFAAKGKRPIIPRAGGTSLAGQVVGTGMVVDTSRYLNKIIEVNVKERWVRVEPGVVLDELNLCVKPMGLMFGPETSTSNRCAIAGMVGNNSCGSHSLVYGSTRDHLLEAEVILSDGSVVVFRNLSEKELKEKQTGGSLESEIYKYFCKLKSNENIIKEIVQNFPDPSLKRRNTGYALDVLLGVNTPELAGNGGAGFNLCNLLAGSEGTLGVITEIKLNLVPLPPKDRVLVCAHCSTIGSAFDANLISLEHGPLAVEMMDYNILELSKSNISQSKNRFFVKGDPAAILIIELADCDRKILDTRIEKLESDLINSGLVYHCSRVFGSDMAKVWELRKAGLGLLSSMAGDTKPVSVIEDTAVAPHRLPQYMKEFGEMLKNHGLSCVYHAHIGTGELHLRPLLNLKKSGDVALFREIAGETALLVKKHKGSLSGEHGDGRLRGEFIPIMFGDNVYSLFKDIKRLFDPDNIFNPGKITDTPAMNSSLRYVPDVPAPHYETYFDYSKFGGWLGAIEQCNGSGDCRKSVLFGGTMCPSFRATGDEKDVTRGRANILRELLTNPKTKLVFDQKEIMDALELCTSCKACKSECPSNVDMTRYKAEFLQHHYNVCHTPLRSYAVAHMADLQKLGSLFPPVYNFFASNRVTSAVIKKIIRFTPFREIPQIDEFRIKRHVNNKPSGAKGKIALFLDEFTRYNEKDVVEAFVELMNRLGYEVVFPTHYESGRAAMSKGLLKRAQRLARKNVSVLKDVISDELQMVGLEPSAILSFRDEYPDLVGDNLRADAEKLASNCLLYDEFIMKEVSAGRINASQFSDKHLKIKLHGHCHQKSLASVEPSARMLSIPVNYSVETMPTGCCGMAGSFGYETEHYEVSMAIGEQTLFPLIRSSEDDVVISAPGVSCREQIKKGTGRKALHPVNILRDALL